METAIAIISALIPLAGLTTSLIITIKKINKEKPTNLEIIFFVIVAKQGNRLCCKIYNSIVIYLEPPSYNYILIQAISVYTLNILCR